MEYTKVIRLSDYDKSKKYLIFYISDCEACKKVINYFKKNNIIHKLYNLDTSEGLAKAAIEGVIQECNQFVPVIKEY